MTSLLDSTIIRRLGDLTTQERRMANRLHNSSYPPGYIFGYIHASRQAKKANGKRKQAAARNAERKAVSYVRRKATKSL